jgi:hypothetical protein
MRREGWSEAPLNKEFGALGPWLAREELTPNGGVKISPIIQQFQGAVGKTIKLRFNNINRLPRISK